MDSKGFLREHPTLTLWIRKFTDWTAILVAASLASWSTSGSWVPDRSEAVAIAVAIPIAAWFYTLGTVYRPWRGESKIKEIYIAVSAWMTVAVTTAFVLFLAGALQNISPGFFAEWFMFGAITICLVRIVTRIGLNRFRAAGRNLRKILLIGGGQSARRAIQRIDKAPWTGYRIAGYLEDYDLPGDLPRLGGIDDIASCLEDHREIDQVWIAMPLSREAEINRIVGILEKYSVDVRYLPDMSGFKLLNHSVSDVAGLPIINVSVTPMVGINRILKMAEDKFLSCLILLLASPLMLLIALAIKLTSPGPVLYRQERVSWNGKTFEILKFRSMPVDTDANGIVWGGATSTKTPTRLGAFLRRTSMDELPQFINVLKGDMSIVGPRPERTVFVEQFRHEIPRYMQKHMVKAGITGWAQVNGWRGDTDLRKRIECDLYYIDNWSLWLDVKIIAMTMFNGVAHRNAA